jgi:hypothetical protein
MSNSRKPEPGLRVERKEKARRKMQEQATACSTEACHV